MKHKFYSLLLIVFLLCTASSFIVSAKETDLGNDIAVVTKVNKKIKLKKSLELENVKDYTYTSSKESVATVSAKGVVTATKAGSTVITVTSNADSSVVATVSVDVKNRYTKKKVRLLSSLIYSEAGGQSYAGKKAVGIVVMNRVRSSSYPNTLKKVIYQPYQFSPARNGSLKKAMELYDNGTLNKDCIKAAKEVLNGDTSVTLNGKEVNMDDYLFFSGSVNGYRLTIGSHQFK